MTACGVVLSILQGYKHGMVASYRKLHKQNTRAFKGRDAFCVNSVRMRGAAWLHCLTVHEIKGPQEPGEDKVKDMGRRRF